MQPTMQPIAQNLANQGRYGDSMLVHMSPQEVGGLQSLARLNGRSMTINPQTGMPEAFFLAPLLGLLGQSMTAGTAMAPLFADPVASGLTTGALTSLATGSLEQGLLSGLGAYGGAEIAGSFANLASPATAAAADAASTIGATQGLAGSAGALKATVEPATSLANLGNIVQKPFAPNAAEIMGKSAPLPDTSLISGVKATPAPIAESVPLSKAASTPLVTPESLSGVTFTPPKSYAERMFEGMGKAFESPSSAMKFAMDNKGSIASAISSVMNSGDKNKDKDKSSSDAMIRPYRYEVDNLSGAPISPTGVEDVRYRGRFIEEEPYSAAQGGLMAYAEGGMTGPISATPAEARVYSQIAAVQRAAGIPALDMGDIEINESGRLNPYVYRPLPTAVEQDYGIYRPRQEDSPSYRELQEKKDEEEFKRGGGVGKGIRKPISRFDPYYEFGTDMTKIAEEQFARGGLSDLGPRFLSGDGDGMSDDIPAVIGGKQPARLADGEFVIPADVVSHLGNGSSKAGAKKLHEMMDRVRKSRTGKKKQAPAVKAEKHMPL